jgi:hypothetical protein
VLGHTRQGQRASCARRAFYVSRSAREVRKRQVITGRCSGAPGSRQLDNYENGVPPQDAARYASALTWPEPNILREWVRHVIQSPSLRFDLSGRDLHAQRLVHQSASDAASFVTGQIVSVDGGKLHNCCVVPLYGDSRSALAVPHVGQQAA